MDNKPQKTKRPQKTNKKRPRKITASYLRNSGLFYLQRFTASSGHFKSVMLNKVRKSCAYHKDQDYEACTALVDTLVEDFLKEGLLDDAGYLRGMVNSLRRSGKSRRAITAKLGQKRIPTADIEAALNHFDEENFEDPREAEFQSALKLARKRKLGPYDETGKYEDDKALNILARQGFAFDTSRRVLNINKEELYELEYSLNRLY